MNNHYYSKMSQQLLGREQWGNEIGHSRVLVLLLSRMFMVMGSITPSRIEPVQPYNEAEGQLCDRVQVNNRTKLFDHLKEIRCLLADLGNTQFGELHRFVTGSSIQLRSTHQRSSIIETQHNRPSNIVAKGVIRSTQFKPCNDGVCMIVELEGENRDFIHVPVSVGCLDWDTPNLPPMYNINSFLQAFGITEPKESIGRYMRLSINDNETKITSNFKEHEFPFIHFFVSGDTPTPL